MLICGVDFETTGLDVATCRVLEIGAVLWDTTRSVPVGMFSTFVQPDGIAEVSAEITELTGITTDDILRRGMPSASAFTLLNEIVDDADDCIVAHNGTMFDRPLYYAECERLGIAPSAKKWIDTSLDVEYPPAIKTRKLTHLAAEHGFLNPFPHRAVTDVLTMLRVLAHYPIVDVVKLAGEPNVLLVADTKKPWEDLAPEGKKETDLARARGFRWDGGRKKWLKQVKESRVKQEIAACEFPVRALEGNPC